ncbi:hypothetical protein [Palpita vitrealis nucleopolyhedrovirus]|uniref:Ac17 n=1 Tax=Palpita vitrealis nucleopolyhedrovirus TaxID=2951960 RepID=A0AAE9LN36_9ABAC|nr:hypothetical protein [Palpita vitrealis nucleopolyhedrovirus]
MNLIVKLTPIDVKGKEQLNCVERYVLSPCTLIDTDICLNVKCCSPFARYKVLIIVNNQKNKFIQTTFCSFNNSVTIVNKLNDKRIIFDGFVKFDDEGVTTPFVIGPLYSVNVNDVVKCSVKDVVNKIQKKQTLLKVFINEANVYNRWNVFKKLIYNNNNNDVILTNRVNKFININKNYKNYVNYNRTINNDTKWVPAINYITGKQLLTILFIFKFT